MRHLFMPIAACVIALGFTSGVSAKEGPNSDGITVLPSVPTPTPEPTPSSSQPDPSVMQMTLDNGTVITDRPGDMLIIQKNVDGTYQIGFKGAQQ